MEDGIWYYVDGTFFKFCFQILLLLRRFCVSDGSGNPHFFWLQLGCTARPRETGLPFETVPVNEARPNNHKRELF
jgi:hypothetical protein